MLQFLSTACSAPARIRWKLPSARLTSVLICGKCTKDLALSRTQDIGLEWTVHCPDTATFWALSYNSRTCSSRVCSADRKKQKKKLLQLATDTISHVFECAKALDTKWWHQIKLHLVLTFVWGKNTTIVFRHRADQQVSTGCVVRGGFEN